MDDLARLSAELEALKQRVALLEAKQASRMTYNWHLTEPRLPNLEDGNPYWELQPTCYEHFIDPAMRMTRNG